jgi:hypothetical protein
MTIDDLARAAASDVRRAAAADVDADLMLQALHRRRRSQNAVSVVAAAAACISIVLVGAVVVMHQQVQHQVSAPTVTATPTNDDPCADAGVTCLGGNRFRVALPVPVTLSMPADFGDLSHVTPSTLEVYRNDVGSTGVSVVENAWPVKNDASWLRDSAAGRTAASMATWLSKRPFLVGATVTPTTVGGREAWRVSGRLRHGAALRAEKGDNGPVAPTFGNRENIEMGYNQTLVGDYTLLDVPRAGVTVIWSWTLDHPRTELRDNQALVDSLTFG